MMYKIIDASYESKREDIHPQGKDLNKVNSWSLPTLLGKDVTISIKVNYQLQLIVKVTEVLRKRQLNGMKANKIGRFTSWSFCTRK